MVQLQADILFRRPRHLGQRDVANLLLAFRLSGHALLPRPVVFRVVIVAADASGCGFDLIVILGIG